MTDIVQILEKIQMIRINVEDDADLREETEEAVGIFACLHQKCIVASDSVIAFDQRQYTADRDRRIHIGRHENVCSHGSCRGLTMGSGDADRNLIVLHHLSQKLRPGEERDFLCDCSGILRIARMDCCCVYNDINAIGNVFGCLLISNSGTSRLQTIGQL